MSVTRNFIPRPAPTLTACTNDLVLLCPRCRSTLGEISRTRYSDDAVLICPACLYPLRQHHGIWNALLPAREDHFRKFIVNYEAIRSAEGRGSTDPDFYLALPDKDLSGRNENQWRIRRRTFECLESDILAPISKRLGRGLDILDAGAGNGWLSYRLALRGERPVAVDLLENEFDGLGAAKHYRVRLPELFPRVRAEFSALPFADEQFDVAIFNASFHYSEDYEHTLTEAMRCVRRPGWIVIADTAWYRNQFSGEAMLTERLSAFVSRFGIASDDLNSLEYLTDARLHALERSLGLKWMQFHPRYGLSWRLRPLFAKLRGRRDPSRFRIYLAEVLR